MAAEKNIPEIRFKGFEGEWDIKNITEISQVFIGLVTTMTTNYRDEGTLLIRNSDIKNNHFEFSVNQIFLDEKFAEENSSRRLKTGDIVTVHTGDVGTSAVVTEKEKGAIGFATINTRPKRGIADSNYLSVYFNADEHKSFAIKMSTGDGRSNYNLKDFFELYIPFPSFPEQTQIGTYFQNLDSLISLHQRKYDKLLTVKKAMLEKMFPKEGADVPEIRFKGFTEEWEAKRFGDCVLIQRGGSPRPIENFITNKNNGINWIKIGDVSIDSRYITKTKEKIIPEGEKHSRKVQKGDLILSNSMSFGRPYIMAIDGCIHDGWLLIRDEKKMFDLEFLLQLLSSDYMLKQYRALASGAVVINLNSELVQSTKVYIPNKNEQHKIGQFFSNLDTLITQHQKELEKLKNLKKACLEKMFV